MNPTAKPLGGGWMMEMWWTLVNDVDQYVKRETRVKEKPEGLLWDSPEPATPSKVWGQNLGADHP